jgi:rubrerythrin
MSDKPTYLGLLNAVAVGEAAAERYLHAWAETTERADVAGVLRTVALREGEHAKAFEKRIDELGYRLRPGEPDDTKVEIASSTDLSDREKFEQLLDDLEIDISDRPDVFTRFFDDKSIDIGTGALLGRYIAEERDSARLLRTCYRALRDAEQNTG